MQSDTHNETYYEALGVSEDASDSEIRNAWVQKTKEVHADKTGDSEQYEHVLNAGKVLKDEEKRQAYDLLGHDEFIDRFGLRGNKKEINISQIRVEVADVSDTSTTESTTASESETTGANTRTTTGTRAEDHHTTTHETGHSQNTTTGSHGSASSTGNSSTGSGQAQSQTTTTGHETGTGGYETSDRTRSDDRSSGTPSITNRVTAAITSLLYAVFIWPLVRFPVTLRLTGLTGSIAAAWFVADSTGHAASGLDIALAITLAAVAFLTIRWVPDYVGAPYPSPSNVLSRIRTSILVILALAATVTVSLSPYPLVDTLEFSVLILMVTVGGVLSVAVMFGVFGVVLSVVVWYGGGTREKMKKATVWTTALGGGLAALMIFTTLGHDPNEDAFIELYTVPTPFPFTEAAPEIGIHFPILLTFILTTIVTAGLLAGSVGAVLLLFHHPQRHAFTGRAIRPTVWETAIAIPVVIGSFALIYGGIQEISVFDTYVSPVLLTETGVIEVVWIPGLLLIVVFMLREFAEPEYSQWWKSKKN